MISVEASKREITPEAQDVIRELLDHAVRVDFPDNPEMGRDGKPKFSKIDEQLRLKTFNDIGNAQRLLARYGDRLMYVEDIGWHGWTGKYWSLKEGKRLVEKAAQETARGMRREVLAAIAFGPREEEYESDKKFKAFLERIEKHRKFVNDCGNMKRLTAMIAAAQTELARHGDDLDRHKFLLTVENGTLCLDDRDGDSVKIKLKNHDPKDMISKIAPVIYDPNATCPKFKKFMDDIVPDIGTQNFLQRFYGYCLTGVVTEQIVVMKYGEGSNGKSTLMDLMGWILGEYAMTVPIKSIMAQDNKQGAGATPDLARLPGSRFVTSSEPESGDRFSVSLIKLISGGEKMVVRHLQQGFFEFYPQFKLCVSFNKKPIVRDGDTGFWRRVMLIPFEERFYNPDDQEYRKGDKPKNKGLSDELREEASGILNWMLDGYLLWREKSFEIPDKIKAATEEYKTETNNVLPFVQQWCEVNGVSLISAADLYEGYSIWCEKNAMDRMKMNGFSRKIKAINGIKGQHDRNGNSYSGINLTVEAWRAVEEGRDNKTMRPRKQEGNYGNENE